MVKLTSLKVIPWYISMYTVYILGQLTNTHNNFKSYIRLMKLDW